LFTSTGLAQTVQQDFTDVHFSDTKHGWILSHTGEKTFVLRTVDSGKTWQSQPVSDLLMRIKFADSNIGWGVGAKGTILRTSDGGRTWETQQSGTTNALYDLFITDHDHVWVSGNHGALLKTDNGGESWVVRNVGADMALTGISFVGVERGWVIGYGAIFSTTDGGITWKRQSSGEWKQLSGVLFTDEKAGWINTMGTSFLKTVDGGMSWQEIVIPGIGTRAIMSFVDSHHGWIALSKGGSTGSNKPYPESTVLITRDGGKAWKKVFHLTSKRGNRAWIFDIFFLDESNGWAVGSDGLYLRTTDGGEHWEKKYLPRTSSNNSFNRSGNSAAFIRQLGCLVRCVPPG
jgi:photosystem II stability/assembly factor-like uncharacterized protein